MISKAILLTVFSSTEQFKHVEHPVTNHVKHPQQGCSRQYMHTVAASVLVRLARLQFKSHFVGLQAKICGISCTDYFQRLMQLFM